MPDNTAANGSANFFQQGLADMGEGRYARAFEAFRQALEEYGTPGPERAAPDYYLLRLFQDFSKGLELLGKKGGFTRARDFFAAALVWAKKLPPEMAGDLIPTLEFFLRLLPLDERLRGLFAHPQDFTHLAEGLDQLLEPLSEIMTDSYLTATLPQVNNLITARTNLCLVLLYLLGRLPPETLSGLVRDKEPDNAPDDLVQWILNQEERALMETGCDKLYQLWPAVAHFAREMTRLGAPEALEEIPEITRARLLSLLAPLRELDIAAGTMLEPSLKRLLQAQSFRAGSEALPAKAADGPTVQCPVPPGRQWLDLVLVIYPRAREIEVALPPVKNRYSFRELGLAHRHNGKTNTLGKVFLLLAEHEGAIGWHTTGADKKLKKQISLLARRLKSIFPALAGSPFYPYQQYRAYKARFKLEISYIEDKDESGEMEEEEEFTDRHPEKDDTDEFDDSAGDDE